MANPLINNFNTAQLVLRNQFYVRKTIWNNTGDDLVFSKGLLLGAISDAGHEDNGWLVPHNASASDGSQQPVAILTEELTIADDDTIEFDVLIKGDVNQGLVVLHSGQDWNTAIGTTGTIYDSVVRNTGIIPVSVTELSQYDNPQTF